MRFDLLSLAIVVVAFVATSELREHFRTSETFPTLNGIEAESILRAHNEDGYHGMLLDLPTNWQPEGTYERSTWMWISPGLISELNEELEERRQRNPEFARRVDLNLASKLESVSAVFPLAIWAQAERAFLMPSSPESERSAEASWKRVEDYLEQRRRPAWAVGRVAEYLDAKIQCDALGLAGVMEQRSRKTVSHDKWLARATNGMQAVAQLDENVFQGAGNFDAAEYPSRIRYARKVIATSAQNMAVKKHE